MNIYIPSITDKHLDECKKCNNKCKNCPLRDNCEFDWIYRLGNTEPELMGNWNSHDQKAVLLGKSKEVRSSYIIATDDHLGFCHYNICLPKGIKGGYVKIDHMCVSKDARGQGHGKFMVEYILKEYDMPIRVICLAGSSADSFWKHMSDKHNGKLIEEKRTSIDRTVNTYEFGENNTDDIEELW